MELIPAIDIRHGRCVRLFKGDFAQETRYDIDPLELPVRYAGWGARWLHVVDLDGAAEGAPKNLDLVRQIRDAADLRIQLGGGIRERASLERVLEVADRVVIGSLAVSSPGRVAQWFDEFGPERITLALDVRLDERGEAFVATHGWTRDSDVTLDAAVERYRDVGLKHVLCTDISRDGALTGPNVELYARCVTRWPEIAFQASGGVRSGADLTALATARVAGAISGKALLEGRIAEAEMKPFLPNA